MLFLPTSVNKHKPINTIKRSTLYSRLVWARINNVTPENARLVHGRGANDVSHLRAEISDNKFDDKKIVQEGR